MMPARMMRTLLQNPSLQSSVLSVLVMKLERLLEEKTPGPCASQGTTMLYNKIVMRTTCMCLRKGVVSPVTSPWF